jgi:hypothetical protein
VQKELIIRDATLADFEAIAEIHRAMGMDYVLPELSHPLFLVRKVAATETGVAAACFLRLTAETYLWMDPNLHPRDKVDTMNQLQPDVLHAAWSLGLDDVEARIPTEIERRFKKRLYCLGWTPNRRGWHPWSRATL